MAETRHNPAQICWIASYPRSGNTWVRFLLTAYFLGKVESSVTVATAVPDLHTSHGEILKRRGRTFVKTHYTWGESHPMAGSTERAIVLLRHPRDVLLSCIGLHRAIGTHGPHGAFHDVDYVRAFIGAGGDPEWMGRGYGTWSAHATSWLENKTVPVLMVRYEDLRKKTESKFAEMLAFAGHHPQAERVAAAVRECSFERMRLIESNDKAVGKEGAFSGTKEALEQGYGFVARGRVGDSLESLSSGLDAEFESKFGDSMQRLGYGRE